MVKLLSFLIFIVAFVWTWFLFNSRSSLGIDVHAGIQSKLSILIEDTIKKQETYIQDVEEPKEWLKFMDKLQELTYRHVLLGEATKGGFIDPEEQHINFDWSKLQSEFKERSAKE